MRKRYGHLFGLLSLLLVPASFTAGCKSGCGGSCSPANDKITPPAATTSATVPVATPSRVNPTASLPPIRIKAGLATSTTDADGNQWLPDQGFTEGDIVDRGDIKIENTKNPALYRTEHYGMTAFSYPVPNGNYVAKLHFAETYDGVSGPGGRVFAFNVGGHEFNNFDVWVKAGGGLRAYVETVPVQVTNGKLDITFAEQPDTPEINGIEILLAP